MAEYPPEIVFLEEISANNAQIFQLMLLETVHDLKRLFVILYRITRLLGWSLWLLNYRLLNECAHLYNHAILELLLGILDFVLVFVLNLVVESFRRVGLGVIYVGVLLSGQGANHTPETEYLN